MDFQAPNAMTEAVSFRWNAAPALLSHLRGELISNSTDGAAQREGVWPEAFRAAAGQALNGFAAYRAHPYRRSIPRVPVIWRSGTTRLLDFGGAGQPVLLIPSLINRSDILDLLPGDSRARWLSAQGFRVFMIDWGSPGETERAFRIGNYIADRILPALKVIRRQSAQVPVGLVGYCMGGVMALGAAALARDDVGALVTLGAPWECSALPEMHQVVRGRDQIEGTLIAFGAGFRSVPPQVAQSFFAMRDPAAAVRKYRRFAENPKDTAAARRFVAIEDWLNSGAPLTVGAARECFVEWFVENALARGRWHLAAGPFDPATLDVPALVVAGRRDRVVPEAVAAPLADSLPNATCLSVDLGHLGLVMGEQSSSLVWQQVATFLAKQACTKRRHA